MGRASLGSRRLCTVLMESPHLIRFIRRLRFAFERDVLTHLARVQFTHVEAILLRAPTSSGRLSTSISSLASALVALPSVRKITLISTIFGDMASLCVLFDQRTLPFDFMLLDDVDVANYRILSSAEGDGTRKHLLVKAFEIGGGAPIQDPCWLVHQPCPLDFSALTGLAIWRHTSPGIIEIMNSAQSSLHTLRIAARTCHTQDSAAKSDSPPQAKRRLASASRNFRHSKISKSSAASVAPTTPRISSRLRGPRTRRHLHSGRCPEHAEH